MIFKSRWGEELFICVVCVDCCAVIDFFLFKFFVLQFGTGLIRGFMSSDTFTLGPIRVSDQSFGEITEETGNVFQVLLCCFDLF